MNKSVLIVTPYFAPQSHAAVFRAHKLAKYLPRFGWKPYVVTVDTNFLYNEDPSLLQELPPEVEVHRARYIEPTLRGLRMALGGKDRRFVALKKCTEAEHSHGGNQNSLSQRYYQAFLQNFAARPDAYRTWCRPAVRIAQSLIARHKIPIIYTTCLPYTCNRIGLNVQSSSVKWVADFRDPAGYSARMTSHLGAVNLQQRAIIRETLENADAITTLSSCYALLFEDMFPGLARGKIAFIPTGLDEDLLPAYDVGPVRPWPFLLFIGEYLPDYDGTFVEVFAKAMQERAVQDTGVRLLVIGHEIINRSRLLPRLRKYGIEDKVEFIDHQSQGELYRFVRDARAGLLIPGRLIHWWANFAKLVDYVALRKPVIAVVPDPSEARSVLSNARNGVFLDGCLAEQVKTLADFLAGRAQSSVPNEHECDRYTAIRQVAEFVRVFEHLIEQNSRREIA